MPEEKKPVDGPKITGIDADEIRNSEIEINQTIEELVVGNKTTLRDQITIINYHYYTERTTVPPAGTTPGEEAGPDLPSPYRGIYHFGPNDAPIFFGREDFTARLVDLANKQNFIALLGASGSGKSSVVFAGLVPALARTGGWKFTHFRPGTGDDPFHALATALVPLYTPHLDETDQIVQALKLAGYLRDQTLSLANVVTQIRANHPATKILLIADQFEELYTLYPDDPLRQRFLDSLIQQTQPASPQPFPLVLVLTMRADFLGQALAYRPFANLLQESNLTLLGPMERDDLARVIVNPAQNLGISFESGLVERILNDVKNQPGSLPLLEFALDLLWKNRKDRHLTHAAYEAIGQVQGALANYAEQRFQSLSEPEQDQARRIFLTLVQPGEGTEDTRRRALKTEIGEAHWPLITRLADDRLVVTSRNAAGEETVEIIHEALIQAWGRLRGWIEEDRAFLTWQKRLRFALEQWLTSGKDEGALWGGALLAEAENWLNVRRDDLGPTECDFIQSSVALREWEQQRDEEIERNRLVLEIFNNQSLDQDLRGVNLRGAKLSGVYLNKADLSRAYLSGADLSNADLSEADLSNADLSNADLSRAYLQGANLSGTNLCGANLSGISLFGVDLRQFVIDDATQIDDKWRLAWEIVNQNAVGRNLSGADLSEADLSAANLRGADLSRATLWATKLRKANLRKANLSGTDLNLTDLSGAIYDEATQWPDGFDPEAAGAIKVEK